MGAASVRAGNVIGGGDYSLDRIVPDCIRAIRQNKPIEESSVYKAMAACPGTTLRLYFISERLFEDPQNSLIHGILVWSGTTKCR